MLFRSDDAHVIDRLVRESPEEAYGQAFFDKLLAETEWALGEPERLARPRS